MNKNKFINLLIIITIVLSLVFGCKKDVSISDTKKTESSKDKKVSIRFVVNNEDPFLQEAVNNFTKINTNIEVKIEVIPWNYFFERVETMIVGKSEPDLLYTPILATGRYSRLGLLLDVQDILSKTDLKDFVPSALATVRYKDGIYGLPHFSDDIAIFYNKNMFKKAGVDVPKSMKSTWIWEEFLESAQKVKEANSLEYGVSTGSDVSQWLGFLYQNRGTVLNKDQTAAGINSPEAIEAIKWFKGWFERGLSPKEVFAGSESAEELFKQGKLPMVITFSGLISQMEADIDNFEYGVTYMPKKKITANKLGGWNIIGFKSTKHPMEVKKLMKFLTSKEQMVNFASKKGVIPTRVSAQKEIDYGSMNEGMQVMMDEINAIPPFAVRDFSLPEYISYKSILTSELQLVVLGKKNPEDAAKDIADQINRSVFK